MSKNKDILLSEANYLQLEKLHEKKITPSQTQALDELLHDIYLTCLPKPNDYNLRKDLVRVFNSIAADVYGNNNSFPVVEAFGSFIMDIFSPKSDLDLSINFSNNDAELSRAEKIRALRKFAKKLYKFQANGHVFGVQPIMSARVPVVKATDSGTGIECDISVENRNGMKQSRIINSISAIDERFKKLGLLIKDWAKAHNINCSKDRTLNSLSLISLVAFHLQTRNPPILPPFSALCKGEADYASVKRNVQTFLNYGANNKESVADLFVTFLIKLASVETLWPKGLCASTYEGSWTFKTFGPRISCINIEDFLERSQNVSRAVGPSEVKTIYTCIHRSLSPIIAFIDGPIQRANLQKFLFSSDFNPSHKIQIKKAFSKPNFQASTSTARNLVPRGYVVPTLKPIQVPRENMLGYVPRLPIRPMSHVQQISYVGPRNRAHSHELDQMTRYHPYHQTG